MKKRVLTFIVAIAMLFGTIGTAFGAEFRASRYLDSYYVSLTADGNGKMIIAAIVNGVSKQDKIGVQEVIIERNVNGAWKYYDALDSVEHPEFYAHNAYEYVDEIIFTGTPGETYRVILTVYAEKNGGWDTGYVTSYATTCK